MIYVEISCDLESVKSMSMLETDHIYDVIIVGAGPAGSVTAKYAAENCSARCVRILP